VQSQLEVELPEKDIHVGPSDHVPWLEDRKWCHIKMEGAAFGGAPLSIDLKLEVWDSPNSAGIVIDAVRYAKDALDRGLAGPQIVPSAYLMKSPPMQMGDQEAYDRLRLGDF
jgi:myo-inositol-1-phosphate synthase